MSLYDIYISLFDSTSYHLGASSSSRILEDLRCQRLAPHRIQEGKAMNAFLDIVSIFAAIVPWLVGVTVSITLENSRWRGIATCITVIATLVAMFTFQTCVWKVNSWDFVSQTMAIVIDMAVLFPAVAYVAMMPFMAEDGEKEE